MHKRKQLIESFIDPRGASILEIGALDSPTYGSDEGRVKFADFASRESLSSRSKANPRYEFDRLVPVDYVIPDTSCFKTIPERFDLIIANHVVEHVPDVIGWLHELGLLLRPGGLLFLSVPDRRYTFDIARRESNFIDLVRRHRARQSKPEFADILDHFWHHKDVSTADLWAGGQNYDPGRMRFSPDECLLHTTRASLLDYADVHVHVFTFESFATICDRLRALHFLGFGVASLFPVERNTNEFHVLLSRFDASNAGSVSI